MAKLRIRVISVLEVDPVIHLGMTKTKMMTAIHNRVKALVEADPKLKCIGLSVQTDDPKKPLE